jgi:hypothetical protein
MFAEDLDHLSPSERSPLSEPSPCVSHTALSWLGGNRRSRETGRGHSGRIETRPLKRYRSWKGLYGVDMPGLGVPIRRCRDVCLCIRELEIKGCPLFYKAMQATNSRLSGLNILSGT